MALGNGLEGGGQVGFGIDAVHLGGLDERGDAAPIPGALVMAGEQGVLARENQGTDAILDRVGVDLDAAVVEEQLQTLPVVSEVGELLAGAGLRRRFARASASQLPKAKTKGLARSCRTARRRSAVWPTISASIR